MRRLAFWIAVGGVGVLANYFVEVAAQHGPPGLARFAARLHQGGGA